MIVFIKIYGLIAVSGIISAVIDKYVLKRNISIVLNSYIYGFLYYISIATVRIITSGGNDFISFSFYDKGIQGYIKVFCLIILVYVSSYLVRRFGGKRFDDWILSFVGFFATEELFYLVLVDQPNINSIVVMALAALVIGGLITLKRDNEKRIDLKSRYKLLSLQLLSLIVQYYVVGPTEIYVYNKEEFIYGYFSIITILVIGSLLILSGIDVLVCNLTSDLLFVTVNVLLAICNVMGYIQAMLLNGKMTELDGSIQVWGHGQIAFNCILWAVFATILVFGFYKYRDKAFKILQIALVYIILIQSVSFVYMIITAGFRHQQENYVTTNGIFELAQRNNVIVFILDAYDTQEMSMIMDQYADWLSPLNDFTYYDHESSRYYYTDLSLPFFITGGNKGQLDIETKSETDEWYDDSYFLGELAQQGHSVRFLTETKYIDKIFGENPVENYCDDWKCILDAEKVMSAFPKTIKYRSMPFLIKNQYKYEILDLMNVITKTDVYHLGTDDLFTQQIREEGLVVTEDTGAYRFYHLYGAHAPYYMRDDGVMDYSSNDPVAQFRGCLVSIYEYISRLKELGIYDDTTIIITADHGLNPGQVDALKSAGVDCDETRSNPIFFIKKKGETHNEMVIDHKDITQDQYFDTVMRCFDDNWENRYYGTIWD